MMNEISYLILGLLIGALLLLYLILYFVADTNRTIKKLYNNYFDEINKVKKAQKEKEKAEVLLYGD